VTLLFFILPERVRWLLLLLASCTFYMAFVPKYILILAFTIVIDYFAGILIESAEGHKRRLFLSASLVANIGVLALFKYYGFLTSNLVAVAHLLGVEAHLPALHILLPIGLSFHTFQAMSYTIEVYRGHQKAERHFGIYSLYVMFYPQLVAGPIERPQNLLPQFRAEHPFDYDRVTAGLKLMALGMFKKVVIADRLASRVDVVYNNVHLHHGLALLSATLFFAFQIYYDFSGYSDIALGAAQVMGFKLMKNFDTPYFAGSLSEFWRRWHISLSTWFRDYLYIPLGGNKRSPLRSSLNLLIVFTVSGLWHGAKWTFVIWGALHGFYLIIGKLTRAGRERWGLPAGRGLPSVLITFLLVMVAWVFFRANDVSDALYVLGHMFRGLSGDVVASLHGVPIGVDNRSVLLCTWLISSMLALEWIDRRYGLFASLSRRRPWVRFSVYFGLAYACLLLGVPDQQFIYFQF
jgi:D-alanyl-lipoteichoic acid acyltransferase DltB (MBOAT superfamily)